jgi:hypothetical protein
MDQMRVRVWGGEGESGTTVIVHPKADSEALDEGAEGVDGLIRVRDALAKAAVQAAGEAAAPRPQEAAASNPVPAPAAAPPPPPLPGADWLWTGIRVRVVDRGFERGAWFKVKGTVVDAPGGGRADVLLDGPSGRVLRTGVPASSLETALPKTGGPVRILLGSRRGGRGTLLSRDADRGVVTVRAQSDDTVLVLGMDEVAEDGS